MAKSLNIENICNLVIAEGLAQSEPDFCERWLCRGEGYIRTLRFRGLKPSADALAICANKLGYYAEVYETSDRPSTQVTGHNLRTLQRLCDEAIDIAARNKWVGSSIH